MRAINIKWDTDGNEELANELPSCIEIPDQAIKDADDEDEELDLVSNYISDLVGFCHYGFELEE